MCFVTSLNPIVVVNSMDDANGNNGNRDENAGSNILLCIYYIVVCLIVNNKLKPFQVSIKCERKFYNIQRINEPSHSLQKVNRCVHTMM